MRERRHAWIAPCLVAAFVVGAAAACFSDRNGTGPMLGGECPEFAIDDLSGAVVVAIRGFAFASDTVRVTAGTRVVWVNCAEESEEEHTTTSDSGVWDSPLMGRGETFSYTFDETGEYPYHCEPHPYMRAVVIVE